ncbi:hypothetical protein EDC04DRAFT_499835 [Pisolithus marmoratus]|nr:hypothetical protein EDC04DRAFT_499835 [Pisolithus marmoratus]
MVNWQSSAEILADSVVFSRFVHTLFGVYLWEVVTSLNFDWQFISGQKRFRWPLVFYFAGRYCLLFALVGILISLDVTEPVNCQALYTFNQVCGNAAIGLASVNLSLRTIAVWSQNRVIVCLLVVVMLGQWSFLLHGILLEAKWLDGACVIISTNNQILAISFIYTMAFDFLVLCLAGWKLAYPAGGRSKLVKLIFGDGLIYFLIAFLSNVLATTFMLLNLNAVMSIIANVPAAIACTIAACRVVRRLANFETIATFGTAGETSILAFRGNTTSDSSRQFTLKHGDGLHIQMDVRRDPVNVELDATGRILKGGDLDPEAQAVHDEFKRPPY